MITMEKIEKLKEEIIKQLIQLKPRNATESYQQGWDDCLAAINKINIQNIENIEILEDVNDIKNIDNGENDIINFLMDNSFNGNDGSYGNCEKIHLTNKQQHFFELLDSNWEYITKESIENTENIENQNDDNNAKNFKFCLYDLMPRFDLENNRWVSAGNYIDITDLIDDLDLDYDKCYFIGNLLQ